MTVTVTATATATVVSGLLAVSLAACATGATLRDPHEHDLSITVHNESGRPICGVHIFHAHNADKGHNWLESQRDIPTGASRAFWVPKRDPAETYQVQALPD